jgi:hypothetical protein
MSHFEDIPLMAVENPGQLNAAQAISGLVIRELLPDEAQLHARVAAAGFLLVSAIARLRRVGHRPQGNEGQSSRKARAISAR